MDFHNFLVHYGSVNQYLLYVVPNILSYAFEFDTWTAKIEELELEGDSVGLFYVYCVIIRKLFFYRLVTIEDEPMIPARTRPNLYDPN